MASGVFATTYPMIVERALERLPSTAAAHLRRKARTALFSVVAKVVWEHGTLDTIRAHLLKTLTVSPWIVMETRHETPSREISR
jgi:hypothetical protein